MSSLESRAAETIDRLRIERDAALRERNEARLAVRFYQGREEHFARALAVSDGGRYRADWDSAIDRVLSALRTIGGLACYRYGCDSYTTLGGRLQAIAVQVAEALRAPSTPATNTKEDARHE